MTTAKTPIFNIDIPKTQVEFNKFMRLYEQFVLSSEKETSQLVQSMLKTTKLSPSSKDIICNCIEATAFYSDKSKITSFFASIEDQPKRNEYYFNILSLADLQILWEDEHTYMQYAHAVKNEVMLTHNMTSEQFNEKRIEFLTQYGLNGYFPYGYDIIPDIEERIKHNFSNEIKLLSSQ